MANDKPAGPDNFEIAYTAQFKGYFSSIDPTDAPSNVLIRGSQNVFKNSNGNIENRPGRKQYDALDATLAGTKAAWVWNTSLGKHYAVRVSNAKFSVLSDITGTKVWYNLLTSLTETRGVFDSWWNNTLKKDQLVLVLGNSSLYSWHGGIGLIASTTSNTIVLTATVASLGFNTTSGSVLVNGTTYTYSGSSSSTLTGVSGDPTGEANGSVVLSAVVTNSTTPASGFSNDFIRIINNRLHVGSYNSRLIYISKNTDFTDFSVPGTRVAGDAELLTLDDNGKGIGVRQGLAYISAGTSDWYIVSYTPVTVGATLTEQTVVEKQETSVGAAAYAHEFIDILNDTIMYLSQDRQLRAFGSFRNLSQPSYPVLSQEVSTDLVNTDFTLGQLRIIAEGDRGDIIYIIAPNSGVVFLHQTRTGIDQYGNVIAERLWHPPFVWGISRIDSINGSTVGFSNSNPQTYTLWDTAQWHDDGAGAGDVLISLSYTSIMLMSYQSYGRRQGKIRFDKIYWEGYMTIGTSLYGAVYYDYQGATALLSPIIHSIIDNSAATNQSFFTGVTPPSLGDSSLGDNPLGDITAVIMGSEALRDQDLVPKFRIITGVAINDCFEFALMAFSSHADDRWAMLALGANVSLAPFSGPEIIKKT